jgi:hypothetical protein
MTFSYKNTQISMSGGKKTLKKSLLEMEKDINQFVHIKIRKNVLITKNNYLILK